MLRCTVNADATTKPEVGMECQNSIKIEVFRLWTLQFFEIYLFIFFIHVCIIMRYDAQSTPTLQLNRKWAWSAKTASKCRFFISRLLKFLKIHFDILQEASTDNGPPFTVAVDATTKLEVGMERQKCVKMQVFRL